VGDGLCEDLVEWLCGKIADAIAAPMGPVIGEIPRTIEIPP